MTYIYGRWPRWLRPKGDGWSTPLASPRKIPRTPGFRVQGPGFRVQDSGFGVQGPGFRVQGLGCRVQSLRLRIRWAPNVTLHIPWSHTAMLHSAAEWRSAAERTWHIQDSQGQNMALSSGLVFQVRGLKCSRCPLVARKRGAIISQLQ